MSINHILRGLLTGVTKNAPSILTGLGVVGVVTTTALAVQATPKAINEIDALKTIASRRRDIPKEDVVLSKKDIFYATWKLYIPTAISGIATISAIFGSHYAHARRGAAIAGAYAVADKALQEYQTSVKEFLGEKEHQKVLDKVVEKEVEKNPPSSEITLSTDESKVLCYDTITGRYFKSDIETIRRAENDINEIILKDMYASLNDFYERIGLQRTSMGETLGWNLDRMLNLSFSSTLTVDSKPCLSVLYDTYPVLDYYKLS